MKFDDVSRWTFIGWLSKLSTWEWHPRVLPMLMDIQQDRDFPNSADYDEIAAYLTIDRHMNAEDLKALDVLWAAYIAQTRGERWEKPEAGDNCEECSLEPF